MEVKDTAACGISSREFAIELDPDELPHIYRIFRYAKTGNGSLDMNFLENLRCQMAFISSESFMVMKANHKWILLPRGMKNCLTGKRTDHANRCA